MNSRACPCCGGRGFGALLSFKDIPVSGVFRKLMTDPMPRLDLDFELCDQCALVRQNANSKPRDYADVTRATALQFPAYVGDLVGKLRQSGIAADDLVLEVGANDGMFLDALLKAGFTRTVGIEPSQQLAATARRRGHKIVCDYFGPDLVPRLLREHGAARAVICRHTLEHVPDPRPFVQALRQCLADKNSVALIEIPDGSAIPDLMNVYEFWDEHLYYFSPGNLARLLAGAGLHIIETAVQPHLETRNLLAWCQPTAPGRESSHLAADRNGLALWQGLVPRWERFVEGFTAALHAAPRPSYVIGASHSQSNLINYAGVGYLVDFYIDDDPAKLGRIPPVKDAQMGICSTEQFENSARIGTVITTGFGYRNWTERLSAHATRHGMTIIDPQQFFIRHGQDKKVA